MRVTSSPLTIGLEARGDGARLLGRDCGLSERGDAVGIALIKCPLDRALEDIPMERGLTLRGGVMGGLKLMGSLGSTMYGGFRSGLLASCPPERFRRTAWRNLRYLVSFDGTDWERALD